MGEKPGPQQPDRQPGKQKPQGRDKPSGGKGKGKKGQQEGSSVDMESYFEEQKFKSEDSAYKPGTPSRRKKGNAERISDTDATYQGTRGDDR